MSAKSNATKARAISELIDGSVDIDTERVAMSIKGIVYGFPTKLEAVATNWPFGIMYTLETNAELDPAQVEPNHPDATRLTIYPRVGRGLMSIITKIVLFESSGMSVGDKGLEKQFNFSYDNRDVAERFVRYPGVHDLLLQLEHYCKFSEMVIKTDAGIYLSQPTSFSALDLDVCRTTFKTLGELGQILFEAF